MEEEASGSKRKAPSCSRCSNHGKNSPLTQHKCPYEECDCLLCKLTWVRKIVMRRQQQLWRQRNETQRWEEAAGTEGGGGETEGGGSGGKQKQKYCDMCRNHGVLMKNRGHKRLCQYENCPCDLCSFTRKRRQIMQLQQKVKRSNITTQQFQEANEWVTKLTAELASLGIDDVPSMSTLVTPVPPAASTRLPSHGPPPFPPSSAAESPFPSTFTAGLIPSSHQIESFPSSSSSSSSHMTRTFVASVSALEQYPSSSFQMETSSSSTAGDPCFSSSSSNAIHIPMASSSSYPSLCPPSPCYTSPSASPISDYDLSFSTCPSSPLLSYPCPDNTRRELTSHHSQQTCAVIRNTTPSSEPLDCSDHLAHSSRSHKYAENRLPEPNESPIIYPNRSVYSKLQSNVLGWGNEQRNVDEGNQEKYWPSQRRNSDGVIQPSYKQNQRRNSDSVIQGIYRPSQRRNSDGVIKKFYGPNQRGNSDEIIQETFCVPEEERRNTDDDEIPPQRRYKADGGSEEVIEECYGGAEVRIQSIHQIDQRRNSDGGILTSYKCNERRNSDGVIRKCLGWNQKGNYDRVVQNYAFSPSEKSGEVTYDNYRQSERRRSSDEASQGSYGVDQRRNSVDFIQENYGPNERGNSDEVNKSYYWSYQRSNSGEISHENNWPNQRRDSDEFIQGNYQSNKDHFFENNLRREHEVLERIDRAMPMDDSSMNLSIERRPYFKDHLPMGENCQQATGILKKPSAARGDEDINLQHNMMNWSDHHAHEETNIHSESLLEQNYEEMEGPLDLTTRPSAKH